MLKASLRILNSSKKIYLFVFLQLLTVFITCIFTVSSIYSRLEYYLPLKDIFNSKASAVTFSGTYTDNGELNGILLDYRNSPLESDIPDMSEVYMRYHPLVNIENDEFDIFSYDKNVISLYSPALDSGKWLDQYNDLIDGKYIPAIIFQNNPKYKIGDTFSGTSTTYNDDRINVEFKVVGILNEEAKIFGNKSDPLNNHLSFYESPNKIYENEIKSGQDAFLLILPNEITDRLDIVSLYDASNGLVTYSTNITERDEALYTSTLNLKYGYASKDISSLKQQSDVYVESQLLVLIPVVLCVVVLALISSICSSAIITKKNLHKYVINSFS